MSRNFSNASAPSTIKARASVGPGGVRGSRTYAFRKYHKIANY